MKTKYFGGALIPLLVPVSAVAQADPASETVAETIVTGTRSGDAVPIDEIGGSVTLLDAQALERIENLFNENYEQVFSFTNPGRAAYAGLRACF